MQAVSHHAAFGGVFQQAANEAGTALFLGISSAFERKSEFATSFRLSSCRCQFFQVTLSQILDHHNIATLAKSVV